MAEQEDKKPIPGTGLDVNKAVDDWRSRKKVGYSGTDTGDLDVDRDFRSRGSALLQKMDFFNLYGLPEYIPSQDNRTDNYLGFMPIIIRNTSFYGDEVGERTTIDSDIGEEFRINIKLPWLPSEISDSVSVSYSRRGNVGTQLPEVLSRFLAKLNKDLANIALVEYNAQNLSKTLDLEFILPINRTLLTMRGTHYTTERSEEELSYERSPIAGRFREENIEVKDFMKNVRAYLGALQGLVYPRAFGFLYPPLLSVKLGGLYRGFKGFLREVNIRTSEEMLDLGNEMFPMIIRGSLRFINVFMYSWSDTRNEIARAFVLSDNPQILFGMDYKDEDLITTISGGENTPTDIPDIIDNLGISTIDVNEPNLVAIQRAYDRYRNFDYTAVNYDNLNRVYQNMKNFNIDQDFNLLSFDPDFIQLINNNYNDIINNMNNDQFNFLGIDNNNESLVLSRQIQNKIGSVQDISSYANLLINIKENDLYGSLTSLSRIIKSTDSELANSVRTIIDLYPPVANLLTTIDSGISLNNVAELYGNILRLIEILESPRSITKNNFNEAIYTDDLYIEKSSYTLNEINKNLNSDITQYNDLAPLITLYFSDLILLETEMLKRLDDLKYVNQLLYERSDDLKNAGLLTEGEVVKYKQVYDQAKKIDTNAANNINELLYLNLSELNEVLE